MTVEELIKELLKLPQKCNVDVEGETYSKGEVIGIEYWEKYNVVTLIVDEE